MSSKYNLSEVLRKFRGASRFTERDVATVLDIPEHIYSSYERNYSIPIYPYLVKLTTLFGVPEGLLFWFAQDALNLPHQPTEQVYQKVREMMQSEVDLYETAIIHNLTQRDAEKYPTGKPSVKTDTLKEREK